MPFDSADRIGRADLSVQCDREIQQEVRIMSHTPVIQIYQMWQRLHLVVFACMIEPARTDGYIAFAAQPLLAIFQSPLALTVMYAVFFGKHTPLCITCPAFFVPDPADSRFGSAEDHDWRIVFFDGVDGLFVFIITVRVDRTCFIGTAVPAVTSVCAVEPVFEQRAIVAHQFMQLGMKLLYVSRLSVIFTVAIPGRKIDSEFQSVFMAGIGKLFHHISFPIFPRGVFHAVFCSSSLPQAKTVVMFGGEDHPF